jgi:hypothetical protein
MEARVYELIKTTILAIFKAFDMEMSDIEIYSDNTIEIKWKSRKEKKQKSE